MGGEDVDSDGAIATDIERLQNTEWWGVAKTHQLSWNDGKHCREPSGVNRVSHMKRDTFYRDMIKGITSMLRTKEIAWTDWSTIFSKHSHTVFLFLASSHMNQTNKQTCSSVLVVSMSVSEAIADEDGTANRLPFACLWCCCQYCIYLLRTEIENT